MQSATRGGALGAGSLVGTHLCRLIPRSSQQWQQRAAGYAGRVSQTLKPLTAANKLGVYLPATPEAFQHTPITRDALEELQTDPPPWLVDLRRTGPFPRDVVAQKLGISRSGLARGGAEDTMDSDQIGTLLADPPDWLVREREIYAEVVAEKERVRDQHQST